jgi:IclR family KDG regulon transcriptional repressor
MSDLAQLTGETVYLGVLDQGQVLYLDKIDSPHSIGMRSRLGVRAPAYCTAMGKVLLTGLEKVELEDYLAGTKLAPCTANTITDPEALKMHLDQIRQLGYGVDEVEHEDGVKCIAAPIRDASGRMAGAISVSAPSFRLSLEKEEVVIKAVMASARQLSGQLGFVEDKALAHGGAVR